MTDKLSEYKGYIGFGIVVATILISVFGQGSMLQNQSELATQRHSQQIEALEKQQKEASESLNTIIQNLQLFKQEMDYKITDIKREISTLKEDLNNRTADSISMNQLRTFIKVFSKENSLKAIDPITLQGVN